MIDIYLPSLYFENLKKYEEKYNAVLKEKNECTDEGQKEILQKELSSIYKKKLSRGYFREGSDNFYLLERLGLDWNAFLPFFTPDGKIPVDTIVKIRGAVLGAPFIVNYKPKPHPLSSLMRSSPLSNAKKEGLKRKFILLLNEAIKRNEALQLRATGSEPLTNEEIEKMKKEQGWVD